ncbi:hypothetical protein GCM10025734_02550 [Kitasatospora paranensis]
MEPMTGTRGRQARSGRLAPGAWPSPIGPEDVAREDGIPGWVELVGEPGDAAVWWDEPRPLEGVGAVWCAGPWTVWWRICCP